MLKKESRPFEALFYVLSLMSTAGPKNWDHPWLDKTNRGVEGALTIRTRRLIGALFYL